MSGIEIVGLVLAIYPVVTSGLEYYDEGMRTLKEWIRFRAEFLAFLNALSRQKIFFRQNMEDLLSSIVSSEHDLVTLLDDPESKLWNDPALEARLKMRLSGKYEYEAFVDVATAIRESLNKLVEKLKIVPGQPHWSTQTSTLGHIKLEYEYRRVKYVLDKKRREKLMDVLEKRNEEIQKLLGNSEKLEPVRKKRKTNTPSYFQQIRNQAAGLHNVLTRAWRCDCVDSHSTRLVLARGNENVFMRDPSSTIKLELLLPQLTKKSHKGSTDDSDSDGWFAAEARAVRGGNATDTRRLPLLQGSGQNLDHRLVPSAQSDVHSSSSDTASSWSRKISFQSVGSQMSGSTVTGQTSVSGENDDEIEDLCAAINDPQRVRHFLGNLSDGASRRYSLHLALDFPFSSTHIRRVVSLDALLGNKDTSEQANSMVLSRRSRVSLAVTLAHSLLHLHSGPWLSERWSKRDVFFFQMEDGSIHVDHPFVLAGFYSSKQMAVASTGTESAKETPGSRHTSTAALLSLGIIILELWHNQKLEDQAFRSQFMSGTGGKNEYTDFNTAQKWQESALEEAGLDLHNATRRCIFCAFGTASQDLQDQELQNAVFEEVIVPLERLLAQFEPQRS